MNYFKISSFFIAAIHSKLYLKCIFILEIFDLTRTRQVKLAISFLDYYSTQSVFNLINLMFEYVWHSE